MTSLKIGTRKSPLALAQAGEVRTRLMAAWPGLVAELVPITTAGDKITDRPLADIGGKGLFTKEIEEALLDGRADIAVHSMKDMPTVLPEGLIIGAMPEREDARDMVVVARDGLKSLLDLEKNITFGTSSLRRAAQVLRLLPDVRIVPLRGNVETRIRKVEQGKVTATMLAVAGLKRLNIKQQVHGVMVPPEQCLPAVGQGAIGIECRESDTRVHDLLAPLRHGPTEIAVTCERAFLRILDGSCRTPIAAYAQIEGAKVRLRGLIAQPDGANCRTVDMKGDAADAEKLGTEAGRQLKANG